MNYFSKNLKHLRKLTATTQDSIAFQVNRTGNTISGWEKDVSEPGIEEMIIISDFFGVKVDDLVKSDLSTVQLNVEEVGGKKQVIVQLNVKGNVQPNVKKQGKKAGFEPPVLAEPVPDYGLKWAKIPITDMAAAAGGGIYNDGPVDSVEFMQLPPRLLKPNRTYLTVRVKGVSMAPTLQDGGYVVIRLLDKAEWAEMHDQRIFVVIDTDGKAYLKRVKNRFKQGFIVLRSDSPEQATYPSFNLQVNEIAMIWYVELYFSAKMPNIHDHYYSKLQQLEDRLDELVGKIPKINHK